MDKVDSLELHLERLNPETDISVRFLKRLAKYLSRRDGIGHQQALDRIARKLGHPSWSVAVHEFAE